jgi:hypothetical protein
MAIYFILIYVVSLTIQSMVDVTIDNRCRNIKLTSPVYFIKDTTCHIQFPQQVNFESVIKVNFITSIDRDRFGGVLLYHLQRKEDTSTSVQLLMIWGYNSEMLYSKAWLIEHEHALVWNEDKLKRLHDVYNRHRNAYLDIESWSLDDNTELETVYRASHGRFGMKIIIFEEIFQQPLIEPLWVDSSR